jgi:hypothetical protein
MATWWWANRPSQLARPVRACVWSPRPRPVQWRGPQRRHGRRGAAGPAATTLVGKELCAWQAFVGEVSPRSGVDGGWRESGGLTAFQRGAGALVCRGVCSELLRIRESDGEVGYAPRHRGEEGRARR